MIPIQIEKYFHIVNSRDIEERKMKSTEVSIVK